MLDKEAMAQFRKVLIAGAGFIFICLSARGSDQKGWGESPVT